MRILDRFTFTLAGAVLITSSLATPLSAGQPSRQMRLARASGRQPAIRVNDDQFQMIAFDIPGAAFNWAVDINNQGMVGGIAQDQNGGEVTFVWYRGNIQTYVHPDYPNSASGPKITITNVPAITNNGLLVGNWGDENHQVGGWYDLNTRQWTELPAFPGKDLNLVWSVNGTGLAVGQGCSGNIYAPENCVAWLWNGRGYRTFSVTDKADTVPQNMNDLGQIVGYWLDPAGYHAFLYQDGVATPLTVNGGVSAAAFDITNWGEILMGAELDPLAPLQPLLYNQGHVTLLPSYPRAQSTGVFATLYTGINDRGDVVGFYVGDNGLPTVLIALHKQP